MELSPFIFGTTVSKSGFTNREPDVDKLYKNLTQGVNTMLISPRRWGKSSLVEKVLAKIELDSDNIKIVSIDLFSVASEEEFLELYAREIIKASSRKWEDWINSGKEFFQQLVPKLSVGIDPVNDFTIGFDWKEIKKYRDEILNLPEMIAEKKNIRFVIGLDEFQNLTSFDAYEQFEKSMRAIWQRQKNVSYCLYGSKRHMMADIFNNPSKPFYRFGDIMLLEKIKREKWITFIVESFKETGKIIDEESAKLIATLMQDHSWYVQQLAHYTWQKTSKKAGKEEVREALKELLYANTPFYQREIESMSRGQLNLLKAIASDEKKLSSAVILEKYKLGTSASVVKNRTILMNNDLIHEVDDRVEFLDPAFELWFKNYFLNVPIF
jgi:hypothetical protein